MALCLAGLLLPAAADAQTAPASRPVAPEIVALDAFVAKSLATRQLPGASIAVVKDGQVVAAKGYGLADVEGKVPASDATVYALASVTKPFTAMATLMLVEGGTLSLDARVTDTLPGLPAAWNGVTIRHLLSHTSGLKNYTDGLNDPAKAFAKDEILALVTGAPLVFQPGERWAYSNTNFFLLGMVIEKVSGKPYAAFVSERIFRPLGMTSTRLTDGSPSASRAAGYALRSGQSERVTPVHPSQPYAAGGLESSVADMAKWEAALAGRRLLKPATYDAMWTPAKLTDGKDAPYGFGWQLDTYRTKTRQAHGGRITGFSTQVLRFPAEKVTIIALVNQEGGSSEGLANGIAEIYVPGLKDLAPKPIEDKDPTLTALLKKVITSASGGSAEAEWLTPEFASFLLPDRVKQGRDMMGRHGPLQSFELMEESMRDARRVRVYRAVFGTTAVRSTFTVTAESKIAGIAISPDN